MLCFKKQNWENVNVGCHCCYQDRHHVSFNKTIMINSYCLGATRTKDAKELLFARQYFIMLVKGYGLQAIDMVDINFKGIHALLVVIGVSFHSIKMALKCLRIAVGKCCLPLRYFIYDV